MQKSSKIVVLNGNGIGQYCDVKEIPRKGETALPRNLRYEEDSGKGVNNAIVIARLGGDVAYIGKAGDDDGGHLNKKWLQEAGVNIEHFWLDPNIPTSLGLILLAENGENIIINFDSPESDITQKEALTHLQAFKDSQHFITGFEIPIDVALESAREAKKLGMVTHLNASPIDKDTNLSNLSYIDYIYINEIETAILLGVEKEKISDWKKAAKDISTQYNVENVIITLGKNGACAHTKEEFIISAAYPAKLVDESGAGDAFLGVVVHKLSQGETLKTAMDYANQYCSLFVEREGTLKSYLYLDEFETLAKRRG